MYGCNALDMKQDWWLERTCLGFALLLLLFAERNLFGAPASGKVIWWGWEPSLQSFYAERTNTTGVLESDGELVTNAVAIATGHSLGLVLRNDGTVLTFGSDSFGGNEVPPGLSNVASVAVEGNSCWAIKRDGTVTMWGTDRDTRNLVASLSNVTAMAWAGYRSYLALKKDGTVLGFRLGDSGLFDGGPSVLAVKVNGEILSNVASVASMDYTPLVLKRDGKVLCLGYQRPGAPPVEPLVTKIDEKTMGIDMGAESWKTPYEYTTADAVMVDGKPLSNVTAMTSGVGRLLALRRDGTVVAWGTNYCGNVSDPRGLSNVTAVAAGGCLNLALKFDGTITAWGNDAAPPAGLSNVVAIAANGPLHLALTTGNIPTSVFIAPHGRLEEMERQADLIFKGEALRSVRITNSAFRNPQMDVHETEFRVISVLKGTFHGNIVKFQHYTKNPGGWSGPGWSPFYRFEPGQSYLVFAAGLDKPDKYYSPATGERKLPDEFRQLAGYARTDDEGVTRTLDARALPDLSVKAAHWFEFSLLLNDNHPTNQIRAIEELDRLSTPRERAEYPHSNDFKRKDVLNLMRPLLKSTDEKVASRAKSCFAAEGGL